MHSPSNASPRFLHLTTRLLTTLVAGYISTAAHGQTLQVFAAGSLRDALTEVAAAFEKRPEGVPVKLTFAASGLLKDRLMGTERADVFASANTEHPQALFNAGKAAPVRSFARNELCALVPQTLDADSPKLVAQMLNPALRLGTSTPKSDPAGDYTWTLFERIEQQGHPGAFATLSTKALQLTGGPQSAPAPAGRNVYGHVMAQGQADIFITYCTNAAVATREQPTLKTIQVPANINVSASYGITTLTGAAPAAERFVEFVLSPPGQAILSGLGFSKP